MSRMIAITLAGLLLAGCVPGSTKPDYYALKLEADRAYEQGELDGALSKYEVLVDEVPLEAEPWFKIGNIYTRQGKPEAAIVAYREALVRDPELTKAWNNLGVIYLRQAVNAYLQLCRHAPAGDGRCERAQEMVGGINALMAPLPATPMPEAPQRDAGPPKAPVAAAPPPPDRDMVPADEGPAAPAEANAPAPALAVGPPARDLEWLARQDPNSCFLQLSSGYRPEPLLALARRFDLTGEAYHLFRAMNSRGETYYQLLQGPFTDCDLAAAAARSLPAPLLKLAPAVRRSGSLQALRGLESGTEGAP